MEPAYLSLSENEWKERIDKAFELVKKCRLCPNECGVNRLVGEIGRCGIAGEVVISSFAPHYGEEPMLSGFRGSGTIFFTGCPLSCVYCQNYDISQERRGYAISGERLSNVMFFLQESGTHNINLVTPTHLVPWILEAIHISAEKGLKLPIVYNTSGYESVEVLQLLSGIVDIYLPDFRYSDDGIGEKYSGIKGYATKAKQALLEMFNQVGELVVDERGIAKRGVIVRLLVLPGDLGGTKEILDFLAEHTQSRIYLSIMAQYRPAYRAWDYPEIAKGVSWEEYLSVVKKAESLGFPYYAQGVP